MDKKFLEWVDSLSKKYQATQLEAAKNVNSLMLSFFSELGREIGESPFKEKN